MLISNRTKIAVGMLLFSIFAVAALADRVRAQERDKPNQNTEAQKGSNEQPRPADMEQLQGRWICTSMEVGGVEFPVSKLRASGSENDFLLDPIIRSEGWMGAGPDGKSLKRYMTIKLIPGAEPRQIDLIGEDLGEIMPGIYKLNGNTLILCIIVDEMAYVRPTRFVSTKKLPVALCVYQRAKDESKHRGLPD